MAIWSRVDGATRADRDGRASIEVRALDHKGLGEVGFDPW